MVVLVCVLTQRQQPSTPETPRPETRGMTSLASSSASSTASAVHLLDDLHFGSRTSHAAANHTATASLAPAVPPVPTIDPQRTDASTVMRTADVRERRSETKPQLCGDVYDFPTCSAGSQGSQGSVEGTSGPALQQLAMVVLVTSTGRVVTLDAVPMDVANPAAAALDANHMKQMAAHWTRRLGMPPRRPIHGLSNAAMFTTGSLPYIRHPNLPAAIVL